MTETTFQRKVMAELKKVSKPYKISDRFRAGIIDIITCYRGIYIALELKVEPNKATPLQEYEIEEIRNHKGSAFVVTLLKNGTIKILDGISEYKSTNLKESIQWLLEQSCSNIRKNLSKM